MNEERSINDDGALAVCIATPPPLGRLRSGPTRIAVGATHGRAQGICSTPTGSNVFGARNRGLPPTAIQVLSLRDVEEMQAVTFSLRLSPTVFLAASKAFAGTSFKEYSRARPSHTCRRANFTVAPTRMPEHSATGLCLKKPGHRRPVAKETSRWTWFDRMINGGVIPA